MFFIVVFLIVIFLIYLRIVFCFVEIVEGLGGDLSIKEVYFGMFEFLFVVLVVFLLNVWYFGCCVGWSIVLDFKEEVGIVELEFRG